MRLTLETERLVLRPFDITDAYDMFNGWASDPLVTKYIKWDVHESIQDTIDILEQWILQYDIPERINFAITLKDTNELIGGIDVVGYIEGMPVIGYNLSPKYWNNGYMTEACKCVVDYLFSIGHKVVRIDAVNENIGSNKVIIKCGGKFIENYKDTMKGKEVIINKYHIMNK